MAREKKSKEINKTETGITEKKPFDLALAIRLVRQAVKGRPRAALFELAAEGFDSVFQVLIACIISIRTRDETTLPVSRRLFERAPTPEQIARLSVEEITSLIRESTFAEAKAPRIREIARLTVEKHGGELPCDAETLMEFEGVGPKCAHLALGIACEQPCISVDIHVHRVTNRWGYVQTRTPEKTMLALQETLPKRYWIEINALLVPFGKHVCTGVSPKCSTCPVLEMCQQVGVTTHR
jgi:endonuclease III